MRHRLILIMAIIFLATAAGQASIFGTVCGIVHDVQHHPIDNAQVTIHAKLSDWHKQETTNADGEFHFDAVPAGEYTIQVQRQGFRGLHKEITVFSGSSPVLHLPMMVSTVEEKVEVSASFDGSNPEAVTSHTAVNRVEIEENPGANRPNSLAFVTNFVPGAYMVHNQLHIRGGHQVSWLVDGVPVPNTNIASNVGAQFDPKDIDFAEMSRGGYSAEYGDRTYGVINVIPRSGFERNEEAELLTSFGSFNETNNQFNLGSHTDHFAYYGSLSGYRTDLGLQTPVSSVIHDRASGEGGFLSLIWNTTSSDQLRLATSIRGDHYQIPNAPDDQLAGVRDTERERDSFANFSWVRTFGPGVLLTVSPFYHYNSAALDRGSSRASQYAGGQLSLAVLRGKHNARLGLYGFAQRDRSLFRVRASEGSVPTITQTEKPSGNLEAIFLEDQWSVTNWMTLQGGVRLTHFSSTLSENAASPRAAAAIRIPKLRWVVRASYGRYYQAPPLDTLSGRLLGILVDPQSAILPLHGERDEQREFGLTIPVGGWVFDFSNFRTNARNFFDHSVIGNSNIFFPLTIASARIRGWEATVRSPRLLKRAQMRLVYSNQSAQGHGVVTGGLTDFSPPAADFFYLDHDQRNTLGLSGEILLPWRTWTSANVSYGSGFLDGNGPGHKPQHVTADFALGKSLGERWSLTFTALNIANKRYLLDDSNTFGGTHFNFPRQFLGELRYRFHY